VPSSTTSPSADAGGGLTAANKIAIGIVTTALGLIVIASLLFYMRKRRTRYGSGRPDFFQGTDGLPRVPNQRLSHIVPGSSVAGGSNMGMSGTTEPPKYSLHARG
jgi:hypothetical protein